MTMNIWQTINDYKLIEDTILFSTYELEALLKQSNYSNPGMNSVDEDSEMQKRLDRKLFHVIVVSGSI